MNEKEKCKCRYVLGADGRADENGTVTAKRRENREERIEKRERKRESDERERESVIWLECKNKTLADAISPLLFHQCYLIDA